MNNSKPLILIVAPPGDLQIGLQALLTIRLKVDVLVTAEGSSALRIIERHNPALVILDHDLPKNNVPMIIQHVKSSWPDIGCIVLVNDDEVRQKIMDTGPDLILIKGIPGSKLVAEIEKLLYSESFDSSVSTDSEDEIQNKKGE
jgi:DNA-binding NarL/FixJ family response regulator